MIFYWFINYCIDLNSNYVLKRIWQDVKTDKSLKKCWESVTYNRSVSTDFINIYPPAKRYIWETQSKYILVATFLYFFIGCYSLAIIFFLFLCKVVDGIIKKTAFCNMINNKSLLIFHYSVGDSFISNICFPILTYNRNYFSERIV